MKPKWWLTCSTVNPKMRYRNGCLCRTKAKYLKWGQFVANFDKQRSKERPDKIIGNGGIIRKIALDCNNNYRWLCVQSVRRLDTKNIPIFNAMKHFAREKLRIANTNLPTVIICSLRIRLRNVSRLFLFSD